MHVLYVYGKHLQLKGKRQSQWEFSEVAATLGYTHQKMWNTHGSRSEKRLQMVDLVAFPHASQRWNYILGDGVCPTNCRQWVLTVTCNKYHVINRTEQVIFIQLAIRRAVEVNIRLYSISESTWLWLANKALSQSAGSLPFGAPFVRIITVVAWLVGKSAERLTRWTGYRWQSPAVLLSIFHRCERRTPVKS